MAVIDLRGSPTGLGQLGQGLATLVGALKADPEDDLLKALMEDTVTMDSIASAERQRRRDIRTGVTPIDPNIGDANVPTEDINLPTRNSLISPEMMEQILVMSPSKGEERLREFFAGQGVDIDQANFDVIMGQGAEAKLARQTAERELKVQELVVAGGYSPEVEAIGVLFAHKLSTQNLEMTEEMMAEVDRIYESSSDLERGKMAISAVNPTFFQLVMQRERFDLEASLASFRDGLSRKTVEELEQERWENFQKMRIERDRVMKLVREAEGDIKNRRDELPVYISDLRTIARDMMRVDPSVAVATANEILGIIRRNRISGVEFSITDITDGAGDEISVYVETLISAGVSDDAKAQLEERLKNSEGRRNRLLEDFIISRAQNLLDNRSTIYGEMNRLAIETAKRRIISPDGITVTQGNIEELERNLNILFRNDPNAPAPSIAQLTDTMTTFEIEQRVQFYILSPTEQLLPRPGAVGIPRTDLGNLRGVSTLNPRR